MIGQDEKRTKKQSPASPREYTSAEVFLPAALAEAGLEIAFKVGPSVRPLIAGGGGRDICPCPPPNLPGEVDICPPPPPNLAGR